MYVFFIVEFPEVFIRARAQKRARLQGFLSSILDGAGKGSVSFEGTDGTGSVFRIAKLTILAKSLEVR